MAKGGPKEVCQVEGCGRNRVGWGLCGLHYARQQRSGTFQPSHRSQARAETISADGTRLCFKCGTRKPFDSEHFPQDRRRPGQLKGTCKSCMRAAVKRATLEASYGISEDEYSAILAAQGGNCAVCSTALDGLTKVTLPHVDHDHASGKVRGILCHHCNVLLGHAKDSAALLQRAIAYLEAENAAS